MTNTYQKYVSKLRLTCDSMSMLIRAIAQAPLASEEEDIDARIKAAESIILAMQDTKRYLLYFKNATTRGDTQQQPPPPPKAG